VNVDVLDARVRLDDKQAGERLAKVFDSGLGAIVGYALPLARDDEKGWRSGPWYVRREHLFLCPAIRPWAIACPSILCPGWRPRIGRRHTTPIRWLRDSLCRRGWSCSPRTPLGKSRKRLRLPA